MTLYKKPYLQPYKGKSTRQPCPSCKTKSSFTRYLDGNTGQPIHPTVGKCNREIKCGYHYTPRQFFIDHPELKNNQTKSQLPNNRSPLKIESSQANPQHSSTQGPAKYKSSTPNQKTVTGPAQHTGMQTALPQQLQSNPSISYSSPPESESPQPESPQPESPHSGSPQRRSPQPEIPQSVFPIPKHRPVLFPQNYPRSTTPADIDFIPFKLVEKSVSCNSNFVHFLRQHFTEEQINKAINKYSLGATKKKEVIFWQIDINGKVRTGKIMLYNPETGRRVKNRSGAINWVHNKLKYNDPAYANFKLSQCYFGEHLLRMYPNKLVAIVEAEKTAVIGSMIFTNYNWLAAGNLNGLNSDKSKVLKDRYVVLYPDAGCYERWKIKMKQIRNDINCQILISGLIENHANTIQTEAGYDIADYILDQLNESKQIKAAEEETHRYHKEPQHPGTPDPIPQTQTPIDTEPQQNSPFSPTLRQMIDLNPSLLTLINEFQLVECQESD